GHVAVCDGNNHSLRGRQPEREVAFVFLNEESDHTLHGREDTTVYYDGLGPTTVLRDVLELALGREMEVDLDSDQRLVLALGGLKLHIDLRAIERGLALGLVEVETNLLHNTAQEGFAGLPHRRPHYVLHVVIGIA